MAGTFRLPTDVLVYGFRMTLTLRLCELEQADPSATLLGRTYQIDPRRLWTF